MMTALKNLARFRKGWQLVSHYRGWSDSPEPFWYRASWRIAFICLLFSFLSFALFLSSFKTKRISFFQRAQLNPPTAITPNTDAPYQVGLCDSTLISCSSSQQSESKEQNLVAGVNAPAYQPPSAPSQLGISADLAKANASVSYPLALPPGPNGFFPALSLAYSSGQVEDIASRHRHPDKSWPEYFAEQNASWVGLGWELTGLPKIVKTYDRINESDQKRHLYYFLVLNGESYTLVPLGDINDPNFSGEWGTEPASFWQIKHRVTGEYQVHNFGDKATLKDYDNFEIIDKSGTKYLFVPALYQLYPGGENETNIVQFHTWVATKMTDKLGNVIKINYPGLEKEQYNERFTNQRCADDQCGLCPQETLFCQEKRVTDKTGFEAMRFASPNKFIHALYPSSIEYGKAKIEFVLGERKDYLPSWREKSSSDQNLAGSEFLQSSFSQYKLSEVKIYLNQKLIRSYKLNQIYTTDELRGEGCDNNFGCQHLLLKSIELADGHGKLFPEFEEYSYYGKDNHFLLASSENHYGKKVTVTYQEEAFPIYFYDPDYPLGSGGDILTNENQQQLYTGMKFIASLKTSFKDPFKPTEPERFYYAEYKIKNEDVKEFGLSSNFNPLSQAKDSQLNNFRFLGLEVVKAINFQEDSLTEKLSENVTWFNLGRYQQEQPTGFVSSLILGTTRKTRVYDSQQRLISETLNDFNSQEMPGQFFYKPHHLYLAQTLNKAFDPDTNLSWCSLIYNGRAADYQRYYDRFGNRLMSVAFGETSCPSVEQEENPANWRGLDKDPADNRLSQTETFPSVSPEAFIAADQYFLTSQVLAQISKIKNSQTGSWEEFSRTKLEYDAHGLLTATTVIGDETTGSPRSVLGYDGFRNPSSATDPLGRQSKTSYDSLFNLFPKTVTNPKGFSSSTIYDFELPNSQTKFGLPVITTDINHLSAFTVYDSFGRPICAYNTFNYRDSLKDHDFVNQETCLGTSPKASSIIYYDDQLGSPGKSAGFLVTKTLSKSINNQNQEIYLTSLTFTDVLGRTIQTQTQVDPEVYLREDGKSPATDQGIAVLVTSTKQGLFGVKEVTQPFFKSINPDNPSLQTEPTNIGKKVNLYNREGQLVQVAYPDGRRTITLATIGKSLVVDAMNRLAMTETDIWGLTTTNKTYNGDLKNFFGGESQDSFVVGEKNNVASRLVYFLRKPSVKTKIVFDPTNSSHKKEIFEFVLNEQKTPRCRFTEESGQTVLKEEDKDRFCLYNETRTVYDSAGRVKYVLDPLVAGEKEAFATIYQETCQQVKNNPHFVYQPDSKLKAHTSFSCYDKLSRPIFSYSPDQGQTSNIIYDLAGNLFSLKDANGQTLSKKYDELNRVTLVQGKEGESQSFRYDYYTYPLPGAVNALGRLVEETSRSSVSSPILEKKYVYDIKGLLREQREVVSGLEGQDKVNALSMEYDHFGRWLKTRLNNQEEITPVYDSLGSLVGQTLSSPAGGSETLYQSPKYNRFGALLEYTLGNLTKETFAYYTEEKRMLLKEHRVEDPQKKDLLSLNYRSYDALGNVGQINFSSSGLDAQTFNYAYDCFDRLKSVSGSQTGNYSYDRLGNLLRKEENQSLVDLQYSDKLQSFGRGKPILAPLKVNEQTFTYDFGGNLTSADNPTYLTWNSFGKAIEIKTTTGQKYQSSYETNGLRFYQKNPDNSFVIYFSNEDRYFAPQGNLFKKVQHFSGPNGRILERTVFADGKVELVFVHQDHLSSATLLTDKNGQKLEGPVAYLPYGEVATSLTKTQYQFTGGKKDGDIGLYLFGVRYYSPKTGRFISPDPLGGGYAYAGDNPIRFNDPTGFIKIDTGPYVPSDYQPDLSPYYGISYEISPGMSAPNISSSMINSTLKTNFSSSQIISSRALENMESFYYSEEYQEALLLYYQEQARVGDPTRLLWDLDNVIRSSNPELQIRAFMDCLSDICAGGLVTYGVSEIAGAVGEIVRSVRSSTPSFDLLDEFTASKEKITLDDLLAEAKRLGVEVKIDTDAFITRALQTGQYHSALALYSRKLRMIFLPEEMDDVSKVAGLLHELQEAANIYPIKAPEIHQFHIASYRKILALAGEIDLDENQILYFGRLLHKARLDLKNLH